MSLQASRLFQIESNAQGLLAISINIIHVIASPDLVGAKQSVSRVTLSAAKGLSEILRHPDFIGIPQNDILLNKSLIIFFFIPADLCVF